MSSFSIPILFLFLGQSADQAYLGSVWRQSCLKEFGLNVFFVNLVLEEGGGGHLV